MNFNLFPSILSYSSDLRDEELAGGELPPSLLHLAVTLQLHVLQLTAALHHALHL